MNIKVQEMLCPQDIGNRLFVLAQAHYRLPVISHFVVVQGNISLNRLSDKETYRLVFCCQLHVFHSFPFRKQEETFLPESKTQHSLLRCSLLEP